jgi:hypothetical protein
MSSRREPTGVDVEEVLRGARAVKERRVAEAFVEDKPTWDDLDLRPTLVFWRAGREVATLHARDRDHALRGARHCVPSFGADAAAFIMDAFQAKQKWFTDRKRGPKPGELGRVLREKGRDDLVTESITVVYADRLGSCRGIGVPFEVDSRARAVVWGEIEEMVEDEYRRIGGAIPDTLRRSFDVEQHMVTLRSLGINPADFDLTDEEARLEADIACVRALARFGYVLKLACYSNADAERVQESLEADSGLGYYGIGPNGPVGNFPPP